MTSTAPQAVAGVIGMGIMGKAYARHLCEAGIEVAGFDVDSAALEALEGWGGKTCGSPAEVAAAADVLLLALPSLKALEDVVSGPEGITGALKRGTVVCEMSTLPVDAKERAAEAVAAAGGTMLDCPVSGTGAQAAVRDLVIYTSGDETAMEVARPVLETLGREIRHVGSFGAGMKMKYVANLLVTIHNLAAAEALLMAERSGLDLQMAFDALSSGAGTSRMFEVRGPMMIADEYEPATMKHDVYVKDLQLIMDHAREIRSPTPLMAAALPFYYAALAEGRDKEDTASLFAVLKGMTQPAG
ncbi:MAG TPA: NAD(P)-dependent oxidoreductase [Afifellaceae bacterium]|nr:NAD(P)-dependent oxidoreductase [Afifellaceae bacterium]